MSFPFCLIALGVATPALAAPPSPASSLGRASDSQTPAAGRSNLHLLLLTAAFPQSAMTFKSFQARSPVSSKARHKVIFISRNCFFIYIYFFLYESNKRITSAVFAVAGGGFEAGGQWVCCVVELKESPPHLPSVRGDSNKIFWGAGGTGMDRGLNATATVAAQRFS